MLWITNFINLLQKDNLKNEIDRYMNALTTIDRQEHYKERTEKRDAIKAKITELNSKLKNL